MNTKAILFDKDGTLMDFDSFWVTVSYLAIGEILQNLQREDIPVQELLAAMGVTNDVTDIHGVLCHGTYGQMGEKIYGVLQKYGVDCTLEQVQKLTVDAYHHHAPEGIVKPACEDIKSVLAALKREGLLLGVVTTDDPYGTRGCLMTMEIGQFFDAVCTDDGMLPPKPDPFCIQALCEQYGLKPEEMVMVGDTLTDRRFARNGGIRFIGVAKSEHNREVLAAEGDTVVPDISHVLSVID